MYCYVKDVNCSWLFIRNFLNIIFIANVKNESESACLINIEVLVFCWCRKYCI